VLKRCRVASSSEGLTYGSGFKGVGDDQVPEQALRGRSISDHVKYVDITAANSPILLTKIYRIGDLEQSDEKIFTCQVTYPWKKKLLGNFIFKYRSHSKRTISFILFE
jgi:hypothetical protein